MMRVIVFDLETTGIDTLQDEPVQLAAEVYEVSDLRYRQVGGLALLIRPVVPIHPKAAEVHGLTMEILAEKGGLPPTEAAKRWHSLVWEHYPASLAGYNIINFDFPILAKFLANYTPGKFKFPPVVDLTDVMFLYCRHQKQRKWPRLEAAAKTLGVPLPKLSLHDARADVTLTWRVLARLMGWLPLEGQE